MALFCHYCSPGTVTIGGKNMQRQTTTLKPQEVVRSWYVVDATGKNLGRLATEVARVLIGKHKPTYSTHMDCGDHVIIVNTDKVVLTGNKLNNKTYTSFSGYIGGLKEVKAKDMMANRSDRAVTIAVKGMLPDGKLGRQMAKKLKVYAGPEHAHTAQKPEVLEF